MVDAHPDNLAEESMSLTFPNQATAATARTYALLSVGAALVTIALKTGAYWLTGSVGLLSDAIESLVNLVAALVILEVREHLVGLGAAEGCGVLNLSLSVADGPGCDLVAAACEAAVEAGCLLVAAGETTTRAALPASLPQVVSAVVDDSLAFGEVREIGSRHFAAPGRPRDLRGLPRAANLWGPSFACARVAVHLARRPR